MNIASMAKRVFLLSLIGLRPNTLKRELDLHPPRACKSPKNVVSAEFTKWLHFYYHFFFSCLLFSSQKCFTLFTLISDMIKIKYVLVTV